MTSAIKSMKTNLVYDNAAIARNLVKTQPKWFIDRAIKITA